MAKSAKEIAEELVRERTRTEAAVPGRPVVERAPEFVEAARKAKQQADFDAAAKRIERRGVSWSEVPGDVAKSTVAGAEKGVAGAPGAPFDIYRMGQLARAYTDAHGWNPFADKRYATGDTQATLALQDEERRQGERPTVFQPETTRKWGGQNWIDTAKGAGVPGIAYKPKTGFGDFAETGAELTTAAVAGGAPRVIERGITAGLRQGTRAAARDAVIGGSAGVGTGAVGAMTDDPTAKTMAGLATGALAAQYGSRTAQQALRDAGSGLNAQQSTQVEDMFRRAQREGVALTRANIADYVSQGASGLSELQRIIESGNRGPMREFFAGPRPSPSGPVTGSGAREYAGRTLEQISPESRVPSTIGPRVAREMGETVNQANREANAAVRPMYQQFENAPVDDAIYQTAMADPVWARTAQDVMNDPELASFLQTTARPGTVGFMQLVEQRVGQRREELLNPRTGEPDRQRAQGILPSHQLAQDTANASSWQNPPGGIPQGQLSPLQRADQQRAIRQEQDIDPLMMGPEGRASRATTTEGAQEAVFPATPREGSHHEVGRAIGNLTQRNPDLAREFVRDYLGTEMHTAFAPNVGGVPYTAGTKFWKTVGGPPDSQQHQNIRAAISALPDGDARWQVAHEMGRIFDAMGQRQAPGSKTASNIETQERLKGAGLGEAAVKWFSGGLGTAKDAIEQWRLGRNMDEITSLITDPERGADFRRIVSLPEGSAARAIALTRLLEATRNTAVAGAAARESTDEPVNYLRLPPQGVP